MDKIIGIGSAGISILNKIANENLKNVNLIAIDSESGSLLQSKAHTTILLNGSGLGAGGDATRGKEFAEANQDTIYEILTNTKRLMLIYGLGGGTGSGVAPVVARLAHVLGVSDIQAVVVYPFTFEGAIRTTYAKNNLISLRAKVQNVNVVQSDDLLMRFVGQQASLEEA